MNNSYFAKNKYVGLAASEYERRRNQMPRWHQELEVVKTYVDGIKEGSSVLDVPFGTGRFVDNYVNRKLSVFGVDISPDMIFSARQSLGKTFAKCNVQVADAEALPFSDNAFDYVISIRFIKWLPTLEIVEKVLSEFARVSRSEIFLQVKVVPDRRFGFMGLRDLGSNAVGVVRRRVRTMLGRMSPVESRAKARRYRDADLQFLFAKLGLVVKPEIVGASQSPGLRYYVLSQNRGA